MGKVNLPTGVNDDTGGILGDTTHSNSGEVERDMYQQIYEFQQRATAIQLENEQRDKRQKEFRFAMQNIMMNIINNAHPLASYIKCKDCGKEFSFDGTVFIGELSKCSECSK